MKSEEERSGWLKNTMLLVLFLSMAFWGWVFYLDDYLRTRYTAQTEAAGQVAQAQPQTMQEVAMLGAEAKPRVPLRYELLDAGFVPPPDAGPDAGLKTDAGTDVLVLDAGKEPIEVANLEIVVKRLQDVEQLTSLGRLEEALIGVKEFRKIRKNSPYLAAKLGTLHFASGEIAAGLTAYESALDGDSGYSLDTIIIGNIVSALAARKSSLHKQAGQLIKKTLKKNALPELRHLAKNGSSKSIRRRAGKLVKKLRR